MFVIAAVLSHAVRSSVDEVIELLSGLAAEGTFNDEAFRQQDDSCDPALSDSWRKSLTTVRVCAVPIISPTNRCTPSPVVEYLCFWLLVFRLWTIVVSRLFML